MAFHVERFQREVLIARIAPVSEQFILCHVAERVLGLPKNYWTRHLQFKIVFASCRKAAC